jgi:hypothetical protein
MADTPVHLATMLLMLWFAVAGVRRIAGERSRDERHA